jgi:hypothetical protein
VNAARGSLEHHRVAAFVQRLRELGWVEGHNLAIEYRWGEGRNERYVELAAEFVRLKVDVIVTVATPPTLAAKQGQLSSRSCSHRRAIRSAPASSLHWRNLAVTSPD